MQSERHPSRAAPDSKLRLDRAARRDHLGRAAHQDRRAPTCPHDANSSKATNNSPSSIVFCRRVGSNSLPLFRHETRGALLDLGSPRRSKFDGSSDVTISHCATTKSDSERLRIPVCGDSGHAQTKFRSKHFFSTLDAFPGRIAGTGSRARPTQTDSSGNGLKLWAN